MKIKLRVIIFFPIHTKRMVLDFEQTKVSAGFIMVFIFVRNNIFWTVDFVQFLPAF